MVCLIVKPKGKYLFFCSNIKGKGNDTRVNAVFIFQQVVLHITWNKGTRAVMSSAAMKSTDNMLSRKITQQFYLSDIFSPSDASKKPQCILAIHLKISITYPYRVYDFQFNFSERKKKNRLVTFTLSNFFLTFETFYFYTKMFIRTLLLAFTN